MRIGIHTSTSGALSKSAEKAIELGANTFQIFSASPRMWRTRLPDPDQITRLQTLREQHDLHPLVIHDSYLINLAAPPSEIRNKSIEGFRGELERALLIGADYLVTHPGNYKGLSLEEGILNVAEALALSWRAVAEPLRLNARLAILLENTAGAGAQLGGHLQELAAIRNRAAPYLDVPIGFCLDTCHCHVAGFNLATKLGFEHLMAEAGQTIGLENVPVIHANDAKAACSSHLDRHANIGAGYIGEEGFRRILNHSELQDKAFILETPIDKPGDDLRNIQALKELVSPQPSTPKGLTTLARSNRSGPNSGDKTHLST